MSWNGHPVIDLDARFYRDYLDPAYVEPYQQLCDAVTQQAQAGNPYSLFGSRTSIVEPIEAGRPLGPRDTFGLTRRSSMEGGRRAFPPGRVDALPPIRPEVSWDVTARLEDMDRAQGDVNVLYPTHVSTPGSARSSSACGSWATTSGSSRATGRTATRHGPRASSRWSSVPDSRSRPNGRS
jgi:hypothetical protein